MKKIFCFFHFLLFIIFSLAVKNEQHHSMLRLTNVTEGIYNIILKKKYSCLTYLGALRASREKFGNSRLNFRISEVKEQLNYNLINNYNDNIDDKDKKYFTIQHIYSHFYIGVKIDTNSNYPIISTDKIIKNSILSYEWEFIKVEDNAFLIHNRAGCYLKDEKNNFVCSEALRHLTDFHLLKLYTEVNITKNDELILEKEPIDVFIKYIDLNDPNLVREGIPQIKKDIDNEELRYSIRSILKNIPWVRKIFILMPNEKVRYFKDYELIKEKIIYVKDKDILGYDSSNSHAFQYRIWKMKEFGLSDNFILMDDDCFIGQPLNKSHFFYVENNKVFPSIINTNYEVHTNTTATKEYNNQKNKLNNNKREQTSTKFMYSVYKTYLFLINYFNSPIVIPYFTHNAIPANLNDIKEIFDLINNSEFKSATLDAKYRHIETLQFQTSLIIYTFNKYKRKSNPLNYNYIDNANTVYGKYNFPLFCINTGNNNEYSDISFAKTKLVMENLFPIPTKYEIFNNTIVPNEAFKIMNILEDELTILRKQKELDNIDKEKFENERISIDYEKCNNQVDMYKAQNAAYTNKNKKRKLELEECKKNCENFEEKKNQLKIGNTKYDIKEEIKEKLDKVIKKNENYEKKINEYISENNNYLMEIKKINNKDKMLYVIIYIELGFIIIFVVIIGIYYPLKNKYNNKNSMNDINFNFRRITRKENNEKLKLFDKIEMDVIK